MSQSLLLPSVRRAAAEGWHEVPQQRTGVQGGGRGSRPCPAPRARRTAPDGCRRKVCSLRAPRLVPRASDVVVGRMEGAPHNLGGGGGGCPPGEPSLRVASGCPRWARRSLAQFVTARLPYTDTNAWCCPVGTRGTAWEKPRGQKAPWGQRSHGVAQEPAPVGFQPAPAAQSQGVRQGGGVSSHPPRLFSL